LGLFVTGEFHKDGFQLGALRVQIDNLNACALHGTQHRAGVHIARIILHGQAAIVAQVAGDGSQVRRRSQRRAGPSVGRFCCRPHICAACGHCHSIRVYQRGAGFGGVWYVCRCAGGICYRLLRRSRSGSDWLSRRSIFWNACLWSDLWPTIRNLLNRDRPKPRHSRRGSRRHGQLHRIFIHSCSLYCRLGGFILKAPQI
jgi:hypothetical protein